MSRVHEAYQRARHGAAATGASSHGAGTEFQSSSYPSETTVARDDLHDRPTTPHRSARSEPLAQPFGRCERLAGGGTLDPGCEEQYRQLAAALHHTALARGVRTVMVASAVPGEGKTLTAANLALTLSESYRRRVLLVDADLRRPMLHTLFGLQEQPGLNEALRSGAPGLPAVPITERLSLVCGGHPEPDPMAVLASDGLRRGLRDAAHQFDWVLIDTPPLGLVPDAHLLGSAVDLAVLVVGAGTAPEAAVRKAAAALGRERIAGVVLNRVDRDVHEASYGGTGYGRYVRTARASQ